MVNFVTGYKCPYCDKTYDKKWDANYCREQCLSFMSDDIIETTIYECEYCQSHNTKIENSKMCELRHQDNKDKYYIKFIELKSKQKLFDVGNEKEQKKLLGD